MINIEVCVDNVESLFSAQQAGAHRIELCAALSEGGLTPNAGLIEMAVKYANVPVYSMIRPRCGDFLYSSFEVEMMLKDIYFAKQQGVQGVVFGVLNEYSEIDKDLLTVLMKAAKGVGVTFHRAIDCCVNYPAGLDVILSAGCERVLTSGLSNNALEGINIIKKMVKQSNERLSIMAGAGVNSGNAIEIIKRTGVQELHLSAKHARQSLMKEVSACGKNSEFLAFSATEQREISTLINVLNTDKNIKTR
ncbi:MAG TPA: copper homeostasis protein CutC [Psychromonas hadalis]|nr:copper homeostasis protein CutC [Psychromonas hadalis]